MLCCYAPPAHALYVADNDWAWPDSKSSGDPSHGPAHPATGSRNGLSLLDLDLDLIGLILDRLKILDLFFLSHTCRAMRVLTRRDWALAVAQATKEERFEFWLDLAWMTPIRKNSLLSPVWDEVRNGAARKSSSFASWIATSFHSRISAASRSMYCLHNVNMQMAWALARMPKEGYHAQLSEVIAQGREFVEVLLRPRVREHRIGPVRRRETVAAKLLQGLLVSVEVDYYNQQSPISFEDFEEYFPDVCLHMGVKRKHESTTSDFLWSIASDSRTAFTKDLRSALDNTGSEIRGFCMYCRTEYSLIARQGRLTVRSWHSFIWGDYHHGVDGFVRPIFPRIDQGRKRFKTMYNAVVLRSFWRTRFPKIPTNQSNQKVRAKFESTDVVVDPDTWKQWSPRVYNWQQSRFRRGFFII